MDTEKKARGTAMELILSVCSGLRKVSAKTPEEEAYNNALGDAFNYIIKNESDCLMPGTVRNGTWKREQNIQSTTVKPTITIPGGLTGKIEWDAGADPFPNAADNFVPATYITVWADCPAGHQLTYDCTVNLRTKEVKIPEIEDPGFDVFVGAYVAIDNKAYPVYEEKEQTSENQFWIGELDRAAISNGTKTYLDNRKQLPFAPIPEGPDEQDYYFCPTCYAIVGVQDEDDMERPNYCPNCGQKLLRQERYEKRMKSRIKDMIHDGILKVEQKEGMLFCCLLREVSFVAPLPAISDDEHNIDNIALVLMHPGAFGISKEAMDSISTMLWKE